MPLTYGQLYDALTAALERASWQDRLLGRGVIHLDRPRVRLGTMSWSSVGGQGDSWGYNARQVRQMRRQALLMMRAVDPAGAVAAHANRLGL